MLLWYSQEARAYALLGALCAISLLYCVRALRSGGRSDARHRPLGGRFGAGAGDALLRRFPARGRDQPGCCGAGAGGDLPGPRHSRTGGAPLALLAYHQMSYAHANGSATSPSATGSGKPRRPSSRRDRRHHRLAPTGRCCRRAAGARSRRPRGAGRLARHRERAPCRGTPAGGLAAAAIGIPLALAIAAPAARTTCSPATAAGALVPLLLAVAIGLTADRPSPRGGTRRRPARLLVPGSASGRASP